MGVAGSSRLTTQELPSELLTMVSPMGVFSSGELSRLLAKPRPAL